MEEEIKAAFTKIGFVLDDEEEILKKCLTFCVQYNRSPSDLVSSWDVYSLNRGLELTVQSGHMGAFLEQLQNEQRDAIIKKEPGLHLYSNDVAMILDDEYEDSKTDLPGTPVDRIEKHHTEPFDSANKTNGTFASARPLDSVTPFGQRKSKFVVQATLNEPSTNITVKVEPDTENSEDDIIKRVPPSKRCSLQIDGSNLGPACRFMYNRTEDKFNFLENRIKKLSDILLSSGLYEEPVDPTVASQKTVFAVGMICCEEEGRLKEKPILLQSSVEHSGGQRVRLDLQKLDHFSIFPGQVVGIEGNNPSGHCLIASRIIDYVPHTAFHDENSRPMKKLAMDQNLQPADPSAGLELSLLVAAGPFTTADNLFFEPLTELLAYARRKQPQLLILLGPFIDSDHPEIRKATLNRTFDDLFRVEILGRLHDYVEYMGPAANVILVPSIRDANHDFVFPQPAFDNLVPDLRHQINSINNPGTFCANEVKIACCNVDILKQLSAEEISRNPSGGSKQRMTNLANHILNQHSFYPLYPPAEGIPLDFSLASEALRITSVPDILILPSDLAHFVRVLSLGKEGGGQEHQKCICINPGRLARGEGGGFFAELTYNGNPDLASAAIIRI